MSGETEFPLGKHPGGLLGPRPSLEDTMDPTASANASACQVPPEWE